MRRPVTFCTRVSCHLAYAAHGPPVGAQIRQGRLYRLASGYALNTPMALLSKTPEFPEETIFIFSTTPLLVTL